MAFFTALGDQTESNPKQGYLAYASINGTAVYPLSGSAEAMGSPVIDEFAGFGNFPGTGIMATGLAAKGVNVEGGTIDFEYVARGGGLLNLMSAAHRGLKFPVIVGTLSKALSLQDCLMESMSLSSGSGGLLQGSITFKSNKNWIPSSVDDVSRAETVPYWVTGNDQVESWSVTVTQELVPIFPNDPSEPDPLYIRVGRTKGQVNITTVGGILKHNSLSIGVGTISYEGVVSSQKMLLGSRGKINRFNYTVELTGEYDSPPPGGSGGPKATVITVS